MKKLFFATFVALSATAVIAFSAVSCKEHCEVDGVAVFELSQSEFQVSNLGEIVSVKVASKVNWTAESTEDWIKLKAEDIESVDGRDADSDFASSIDKPFNFDRAGGYVTVEIEVAENDNVESRVGEVVFTTKDGQVYSLEIAQDGDPTAMPSDMELAFPDPIFRAYVMENFDTDKDGKISEEEAEEVTKIEVGKDTSTPDNEKIASLEGIQYFTNLTYLSCYNNKLTELDVTQNPALIWLYCSPNQLTELDVTQNPMLEELECYWNKLTELDVTHNPALEYLICYNNQLTELDVTQNPALEYLWCYSNQLTTLDVSRTNLGNSRLEIPIPLWCSPMKGSGLETLYLKEGWTIKYIYPERDDYYVPANTEIKFKD